MRSVVGKLAGAYPGPILVVGGGIRAPSDLAALGDKKYAATIFANGHGFRLPGLRADFIVCKDHYNTQTRERMERLLRVHNVPIISRHYWADYRLLDWNIPGNSGYMAIVIAAILGGGPIYPIGFDCYQEGTYWYDPTAKNVSSHRSSNEMKQRALKVTEYTLGTCIRPVSGPLCQTFQRFTPGSFAMNYQEPAIVARYRDMPAIPVRAVHELALPFDARARIIPGKEFWVSQTEYSNTNVKQNVKVLDTVPEYMR